MDIHHQLPDEAVATNDDTCPFAVRGQTRTICRWRIPQKPLEGKEADTKRQAALDLEEKAKAKEEWDDLNALYCVSDSEWEAAETQWREWVAKRDTAGALDPGRFYIPPAKAPWQEHGGGDESCFSKVLRPQHEKCLACSAIITVSGDVTLSTEEKKWRLARLAHTVPKLQPLPSTAGPISLRVLGESNFDDLVKVSAWGHEHPRRAEDNGLPSKVRGLRAILPKADILEPKPGSQHEFTDRKEDFSTTSILLRNTDDTALLEAVMHDPALLQRAHVFWENRKIVENAIKADGAFQCLSVVDKKAASKAAAEVWELERDLVRLEKIKDSLEARIDFAQKGYSVNQYNTKRCMDRRENWADTGNHRIGYGTLGLHRRSSASDGEEEPKDKGVEMAGQNEEEKILVVEDSVGSMELEHQQRQTLPNEQVQAGVELDVRPETSQSPPSLTKSPVQIEDEQLAQSTAARNLFFNTMRNSHQHNREIAQEDSESPSTEGDPFKYDAMRVSLSSTHEAARSGNGKAAEITSKGKAKKDSKAEGLLEEDRVSLKDFAATSEKKKKKKKKTTKGLRKLSVKRGSSSRPRWHA